MRSSTPTRAERVLRALQWSCLVAGGTLVLFYVGVRADATASANAAVERFEAARKAAATTADPHLPSAADLPVDQTLWAKGRIAKYEESLAHDPGLPLAVLRIPEIDLAVPVYAGTGDVVLDRAVGHIEGTPAPGEAGNIGIAGHRDGFFRGLKDVAPGDELVLETLAGRRVYEIDDLSIVEPTDVGVLDPTDEPTLTLVTCYPFYFVGSAPQRFIVRAREVSTRNP